MLVAAVPIPGKRRRRVDPTLMSAPRSQGQAMLARARTGMAMRTRQMMRAPRRPGVRAAPPAVPPGRGGSVGITAPAKSPSAARDMQRRGDRTM